MLEIQNCRICRHLDYRVFYCIGYEAMTGQLYCAVNPKISDNLRHFPFDCEMKCCEPKGE